MPEYNYKTFKDEDGAKHISVYKDQLLSHVFISYHSSNFNIDQCGDMLNKKVVSKFIDNHEFENGAEVQFISQLDVMKFYHKGMDSETIFDIDDLLREGYDVYLITDTDGLTVIDHKIYGEPICWDEGEKRLGQLLSGTAESYIKFRFRDCVIED